MGIFTDSLSSLQAIWHRYTNPGTNDPHHYHYHRLLLSDIADLLEERRRKGFSTTLHKLRAHTNIRGNDLTDAAAKLTVTRYDSLPESQKLKVCVGEIAPRPLTGLCTPQNPRSPPQSWGRIRGRLRYANRGGQSLKGRDFKCTPSRDHPFNYNIK